MDVVLTCKRCNESFKYTAKEQAFYKSKSFAPPKCCGVCRQTRKEEAAKRSAVIGVDGNATMGSIVSGKRKASEAGGGFEEEDTPTQESAIKRRRSSNEEATTQSIRTEKEADPHKIEMRLKQIQYGFNTAAYDNYIAQVPKNQRTTRYDEHPRTPDPYTKQSKQ